MGALLIFSGDQGSSEKDADAERKQGQYNCRYGAPLGSITRDDHKATGDIAIHITAHKVVLLKSRMQDVGIKHEQIGQYNESQKAERGQQTIALPYQPDHWNTSFKNGSSCNIGIDS